MNVQDELISELKPQIESGSIVIDADSEKYARAIEDAFPFHGSKIDWSRVPGAVEKSVPLNEFSESGYRLFCDEVERNNLKGEVCVLSDNAFDFALVMSIDTLRDCLSVLLDVPQHLYVVAGDISWCLTFTMEGDVTFGFRPTAQAVIPAK